MPTKQTGTAVRRQLQRAGHRGINPVAQSLLNVGVKAANVRAASWFTYSTPAAVALGTSASGTSNIQIQADSVFQLKRLTGFVFITGTPETAITLPPLTLQITDTSSGANLFDVAVPLFTVAYLGAGFGPFELPAETQRFFAPNATVTLALANLSAANAYTIRVNLQGNKLYA